jgi:hypothetical protein
MDLPYPKPKTFSDPHHDWQGFDAEFEMIVALRPNDLAPRHFEMIFGGGLPAADYEEGVYYIEACFRRMARKENTIESNLCGDPFWFINHHRLRLAADGLLEPCLGLIAALLRTYTESFELVRLTDEALTEHGIDPNFRELVRFGWTVEELVDALVEYELFWDTLDHFLVSLGGQGVIGSCWWVEIAYHARWWYITHGARSDNEAEGRRQRVLHRLLALDAYPEHLVAVREYARGLGFGGYYERVSIV